MTVHVPPSEPRGTEPARWRPFELVTFDPTKIDESPWNRSIEWGGDFVAVNDLGLPSDVGDGGLHLLRGDVRPNAIIAARRVGDDPEDNRSAFVERVLALTPGGGAAIHRAARLWPQTTAEADALVLALKFFVEEMRNDGNEVYVNRVRSIEAMLGRAGIEI